MRTFILTHSVSSKRSARSAIPDTAEPIEGVVFASGVCVVDWNGRMAASYRSIDELLAKLSLEARRLQLTWTS